MKSLEEYEAFSYVAWTLVIGFAFFVGHMTFEAQENISSFDQNDVVYAELQAELLE